MKLPTRDDYRQLIGAVLFVIAIAICLFVMLFGPSSWVTFINKWQTILGGFVAAIAAFFTVLQMQISDRKAAERHNQLFAAELRSDRLKLRHARFRLDLSRSQVYQLKALADDLEALVGSFMLNSRNGPNEATNTLLENAWNTRLRMEEPYRLLSVVLRSDWLREAAKLFGPRLREIYETLEERSISQPAIWRISLDPNDPQFPGMSFETLRNVDPAAIKPVADSIIKNVVSLEKEWNELLVGIDRLVRLYPVALDGE